MTRTSSDRHVLTRTRPNPIQFRPSLVHLSFAEITHDVGSSPSPGSTGLLGMPHRTNFGEDSRRLVVDTRQRTRPDHPGMFDRTR